MVSIRTLSIKYHEQINDTSTSLQWRTLTARHLQGPHSIIKTPIPVNSRLGPRVMRPHTIKPTSEQTNGISRCAFPFLLPLYCCKTASQLLSGSVRHPSFFYLRPLTLHFIDSIIVSLESLILIILILFMSFVSFFLLLIPVALLIRSRSFSYRCTLLYLQS